MGSPGRWSRVWVALTGFAVAGALALGCGGTAPPRVGETAEAITGGNGQRCNIGADCQSGVCSASGASTLMYCRAPSCSDGVKNGTETDVDCGGSCATRCADLQGCHAAVDCRSDICTNGTCQAPTCHDGTKNGDETDVDCGGSCFACHDGQRCAVVTDCRIGDACSASNPGNNTYCRQPNPTCTNHAFNPTEGETDVDCGGPCKPCANGLHCAIGADCRSKVCAVVGLARPATPQAIFTGTCSAPTCTDGEQNGDETGIDCGGSCGATCGESQHCNTGADCASGVCIRDGNHRVCSSPLVNGSFEAGTFAGWITQDLAQPFSPLRVTGNGTTQWPPFGWTTMATDGNFVAFTGYDGCGPGTIDVSQDLTTVPFPNFSVKFDYRAGWDLQTFGASMDRTFSFLVEPAGGGAPLSSNTIVASHAGDLVNDTGNQTASLDLSAFSGVPIRIHFQWTIPQCYSGPAQFQLDNVRLSTP